MDRLQLWPCGRCVWRTGPGCPLWPTWWCGLWWRTGGPASSTTPSSWRAPGQHRGHLQTYNLHLDLDLCRYETKFNKCFHFWRWSLRILKIFAKFCWQLYCVLVQGARAARPLPGHAAQDRAQRGAARGRQHHHHARQVLSRAGRSLSVR